MSNFASNIIKEDISNWVRRVIIKYCPVFDDRSFITEDATKEPKMDIEIEYNNNHTLIYFLFGTSSFKQSLAERCMIDGYLPLSDVNRIIDTILFDHRVFSSIIISDDIEMKLSINWSEKALRGITCGDIRVRIKSSFGLPNVYITEFLKNYKDKLEGVPFFKELKEQYFLSTKNDYINSLDRTSLLDLFKSLDDDELRELASNINIEKIKHFSLNPQKNIND